MSADIRRNLDHLRFLDDTSVELIERWRDAQERCLVNVEEVLMAEFSAYNDNDDDDDNDDDNKKNESNRVLAEIIEDTMTTKEEDAPMEDVAEQTINENGQQQQSRKKRGRSAMIMSEMDDLSPPTKTESPLKRDSPRNQPQRASSNPAVAKEEIMKSAIKSEGRSRTSSVVKKMETLESDDDININNGEEELDKDGGVTANDGINYNNKIQGNSMEQHDQLQQKHLPPMLLQLLSNITQQRCPPTVHERIQSALSTEYTIQHSDITNMYHKLQQYNNEKLHTAQQIRSLVEMACGRLDRDLALFEQELGIVSTSTTNAGTLNDYSISGGGVVGIGGGTALQSQQQGMTNTGMNSIGGGIGPSFLTNHAVDRRSSAPPMMMAASAHHASFDTVAASMSSSNIGMNGPPSVVSSRSVLETLSQLPPVPPPPPPHASLPQKLLPKVTSMRLPPPPSSKATVQPTTLAAIQVVPNSDWILAKILAHDRATRTYTLSDEDVQSSDQVYVISDRERRVVPLRNTEHNKWVRGDEVYAVYPDTTSFYPAMVSTPPFNGYVMVQFANDEDGNGITHEKAVLSVHVMKVPPMKVPAK